jgi:hypothetical protein
LIDDATKGASGTFHHEAKINGKYEYCFSNAFSTVTDKTVGFNVFVAKPYKADPSMCFFSCFELSCIILQ